MHTGEILKSLGGASAVAKALGLSLQAVSNWSMRDAIASEHRVAIWRLAMAKNVEWAPPGAEGLVLASAAEQSRSEREVLASFRSTDEQDREMILRFAKALRREAPALLEAAE